MVKFTPYHRLNNWAKIKRLTGDGKSAQSKTNVPRYTPCWLLEWLKDKGSVSKDIYCLVLNWQNKINTKMKMYKAALQVWLT